jgi:nitrogen regulatory protein P-II 1
MVTHSRIEIFTEKNRAEEIAHAIMEAAYSGTPGDGIVVILPVEKVFLFGREPRRSPMKFNYVFQLLAGD